MKHFKFKKGILACLLSLALALTCIGTVGIKANETINGKCKVTFSVTYNTKTYKYEKEIAWSATSGEDTIDNYIPGDGKVVTVSEFLSKAVATSGEDTINLKDVAVAKNLADGSSFAESGEDIADAKWELTAEDLSANSGAKNVAVDVNFVPKKINYIFNIKYNNVDYVAKIEKENSKDNVTITADEIIAAAKTAGEDPKALADEGVVLTNINGVNQTSAAGKFEYTPDNLADGDVSIAASNMDAEKAFEVEYVSEADVLVFTSPVKDLVISYADVKKATGGTISKFATLKTDGTAGAEEYTASLPLNDKSKGLKIAEAKTAYIYAVAGKATPEKKKTYAPNVVVDGTSIKKIVVTYNYAVADPSYEDVAISKVVITDANKTTTTYTASTDAEKQAAYVGILNKLQYTVDGKTWYYVIGDYNTPVITGYIVGESSKSGAEVKVTDYKKLKEGTYKYVAAGEKHWKLDGSDVTTKVGACKTSAGDDKSGVTVTVKDACELTETTTYTYVGAIVDDNDPDTVVRAAGFYNDETAMPETIVYSPEDAEFAAGDKIVVTVTTTYKYLEDGATVTAAEGVTFAADDAIVLIATVDDGSLSGARLYEWTQMSKAPKVQFRLLGSRATGEGENAKNAVRNSKAAKGAPKKAAKASKVKVDGAAGTLAIKNGFDYAVMTSKTDVPSLENWHTVLPFNKEGAAETSVISTETFVPVKKFSADTNKSFTKDKVKAISVDDLFDLVDESATSIYIYVRKSATEGKPASAASSVIEIKRRTAAPTIKVTNGNYAIAENADAVDLVVPEIKNAGTDKNAGTYEYLIVDKAETIEKINMTTAKWTKIAAGGKLTVGKSSSKYSLKDGTAVTCTLAENYIILVRRAGDKKSGVLASDWVQTTVKKVTATINKESVQVYGWTALQ